MISRSLIRSSTASMVRQAERSVASRRLTTRTQPDSGRLAPRPSARTSGKRWISNLVRRGYVRLPRPAQGDRHRTGRGWPEDKRAIYDQLGVNLTYRPESNAVHAGAGGPAVLRVACRRGDLNSPGRRAGSCRRVPVRPAIAGVSAIGRPTAYRGVPFDIRAFQDLRGQIDDKHSGVSDTGQREPSVATLIR